MKIKTSALMEVVSNERTYQFFIPDGAPFGEACDAASEILAGLIKLAKQNQEKLRKESQNIKAKE